MQTEIQHFQVVMYSHFRKNDRKNAFFKRLSPLSPLPSPLFAPCSTLPALLSPLYALRSPLFALCSLLFAPCSTLSPLPSPLLALSSLLYALRSPLLALSNVTKIERNILKI